MYHPYTDTVASEILKETTAEDHAATEKQLLLFLKKIQAGSDYVNLLVTLYGYYKPLETEIEKFLTPHDLPDIKERRKAESIKHDLATLHSNHTPADSHYLPVISSKAEAWGAMYVLEGSTLGGRYIAAMLKKKDLGLQEANLHFFDGYGDDLHQKWDFFTATLNYAAKDLQAEEMIASAKATFLNLKLWIEHRLC